MLMRVPHAEIKRSLDGALAILFNKPNPLSNFNLTPQGFWNSFHAFFLLIAPIGLAALTDRTFFIERFEVALAEFPSFLFFATRYAGL